MNKVLAAEARACAASRGGSRGRILGPRLFHSFLGTAEDAGERPAQRRRTNWGPEEAPRVLPGATCESLAVSPRLSAGMGLTGTQPVGGSPYTRLAPDMGAEAMLRQGFLQEQHSSCLRGEGAGHQGVPPTGLESLPREPQAAAGPISWGSSLCSARKTTFVPLKDESNHSVAFQDCMDLDNAVQYSTDEADAACFARGHGLAEECAQQHHQHGMADKRMNFFGNRNGSARTLMAN